MGVKPGEPFTVTEFLKPGIEEMCSLLPPRLARRILALSERRGWIDRVHWGMEVNSASVSGFLRFWMLAKLRGWRPKSYRFAAGAARDRGLARLSSSRRRALSADLALEVAECARLIKGYGDTHKRGTANYRLIEARVIRPALAGRIPLRQGVDATASARAAALLDPDGEALDALPRGARRPPQPAHCRRVTFARQNARPPRDGLQSIKQVTNPVHFTRPGARSPRPDIHANHARRTGK